MHFLNNNTSKYLEMENQDKETVSKLSIVWKQVLEKKYIISSSDHFTAAKVFYYNKDKQEAQEMLQKAFELKDDTFDEEKYKELENQINQL